MQASFSASFQHITFYFTLLSTTLEGRHCTLLYRTHCALLDMGIEVGLVPEGFPTVSTTEQIATVHTTHVLSYTLLLCRALEREDLDGVHPLDELAQDTLGGKVVVAGATEIVL